MNFSRWQALDELVRRGPQPTSADGRPEESHWIQAPEPMRVSTALRPAAFFSVWLIIFGAGSTAIWASNRSVNVDNVPPGCFLAIIAGLCALCYVARLGGFSRYVPARSADLRLAEDLPEPTWLVEIDIHVDGERKGHDQGVIGFVDGALFFAGRSASFLLGSQDLKSPVAELNLGRLFARSYGMGGRQVNPGSPGHTRAMQVHRRMWLLLKDPKLDIGVAIFILARPGRNPKAEDDSLRRTVDDFYRAEPTTLPRCYPPLIYAPERRSN